MIYERNNKRDFVLLLSLENLSASDILVFNIKVLKISDRFFSNSNMNFSKTMFPFEMENTENIFRLIV
jgi:hypothetical protein